MIRRRCLCAATSVGAWAGVTGLLLCLAVSSLTAATSSGVGPIPDESGGTIRGVDRGSGFTGRSEDQPAQTGIAVFGPETFTRGTGRPRAVTRTFRVTDPAGPFVLRIVNRGVTSAEIDLNGRKVLGPEDFKSGNEDRDRGRNNDGRGRSDASEDRGQTAPSRAANDKDDRRSEKDDEDFAPLIERAITLRAGTNQITVELRSKPGTSLTIEILRPNVRTPAVLTISKGHSGSFTQGEAGRTYQVTVSNAANAGPTSGTVAVTDAPPQGLTLVSMSGVGWQCSSLMCTRNDPLAAGASYPPITATVNVAPTATSPQVNTVTVSGGGSANASATDPTIVVPNLASLTLVKSATPTTYSAVGASVSYTYVVTDSGNTTLSGPFTVQDNKTSVTCPATGSLSPGASITCTASYAITQADIDGGAVTNIASATNGTVTSATATQTVTAVKTPVMTLVKTATPATYSAVGANISYSYLITNSGNTSLSGPFVVNDNKATVGCPATVLVVPGASITCTASYAITQGDIDGGAVTNTASATNGTVTSATATQTVTAVKTPVLTLAKTATPGTYAAVGASITYSYVVTNGGNTTLSGPFTVQDNKTSVTCPATGSLSPGASITCTASYAITQADIDGGAVTNIASATNGTVTSATATQTVTAVKTPVLTLAKAATPGTYAAVGASVSYSYVVTNGGNTTLSGPFTVQDNKTTATCPATESLAPGALITCTASYAITQADIDAGAVTNIASASNGAVTSTTSTQTVTAVKTPVLTLAKTATPGTYAAVGASISYSYVVTNGGNTTLSEPITVQDNKTSVTCPATGSLAPGASITCTASYAITQADIDGGAVTNIASATNGPVTSATATQTVTAVKTPVMTLVKTATPATYSAVGASIGYSYVVTNGGNTTLTGPFTVEDNKATVTCPATETLAPRAAFTCTASYAITQADIDAGVVTNVATSTNGTVTSAAATQTVTAIKTPVLTLTKAATPRTYAAVGASISYSYVVTNGGNTTLSGPFTVQDNKATVSCPSTGSLAPGASIACTASYAVTQADIDAGAVTNVASATNGTVTSPTATQTVTAVKTPVLTLTKTATPLTYAAVSASISYSYVVANSGNTTLTGPFTVEDNKATVTCPATISLAPGAAITCTASYAITQADIDAGAVTNVASASNGTVTSATATQTVTAVKTPVLTLVKTATPAIYSAVGASISYSYVVANGGNTTLNGPFTVQDNKATVSCPATESLAPGASITCTASYAITQRDIDAGAVTNVASASNGTVTSPTATQTVTAVKTPVLTLAKTATPATYSAVGASISYGYVVTNAGNTTLNGPFTVQDNKTTVTCPATGSLTPGTSITCTASYAITQADIDAGAVTNVASVTNGPVTSTTAIQTVTAVKTPVLTLVKTATPATYSAVGASIIYSYVVANGGNTTLSGPLIVDDNKATVTCPATERLAPGAAITCTANYAITQADIDAGAVTNVASASNGTVTSATATQTVTAVKTPVLTLVKTATPATYSAVGASIVYSYVVANAGNTTLSGPFTVQDNKATVTCPATGSLSPGASITCTASYSVTQVDIDAGALTNVASASNGTVTSATAAQTVTAVKPALTITKTHTGNFTQGQQGATYSVIVSNAAGAGATSGAVTVTDTMPTGLTLVSLAGAGWQCTGNSCGRGDGLPGGGSYPALTVTVNVATKATSPQVNAVTVSGAGSASASASDSTIVISTSPVITDFAPHSAPVGTLVTVTGNNLAPNPRITLNRLVGGPIEAPVGTTTPTSIAFTIPAGATTGPIVATVNSDSATSATPLTIVASRDFTVGVQPSTASLIAGQSVSFAVSLTSANAFSQLASLNVTGVPAGASVSFTPPSITAGQTSVLTVTAPSGQVPGSATLTIAASATVDGLAVSPTAQVQLNVATATTSLLGRTVVSDPLETPLANVTITMLGKNGNGGATNCSGSTMSDAAGNFTLSGLGAGCVGPQLVGYDGLTAASPDGKYAGVNLVYTFAADQATASPVLVHLPRIDDKETFFVHQNAAVDQSFSYKTIPGLSVTVYKGTTFTLEDGSRPDPFPLVAVQVPVDRLPDQKPPVPTMLSVFIVAFQPANAVASQPAAVFYPNTLNTPPGVNMTLMTLDPTRGRMIPYGTATVSAGGSQIVPDLNPAFPGRRYGIVNFDWHGPMPPPIVQTPNGPNSINPTSAGGGCDGSGDSCSHGGTCECPVTGGANPVDLSSGLETIVHTDISIGGPRGTVSMRRFFRTLSTFAGPFGIGTNHNYGYSLDTVNPQSAALINLIAPDGNRFPFTKELPSAEPGTPVPVTNELRNYTNPAMVGAVVTVLPTEVQLRWKDGTVYRFVSPAANFTLLLESITDPNGNKISITRGANPNQIAQVADPVGRTLRLAYDGASRITSITDPIGRVVSYTYNAQGILETVTDPEGGVTKYEYDNANRPIKETDPRGTVVAQSTYDTTGRVLTQTQADGGVFHFDYHLFNDTAPTGPIMATVVTDPLRRKTHYRFSPVGFLMQRTAFATGQVYVIRRDALTNHVVLRQPIGTSVGQETFERDALGNLLRHVDALGRATTYSYDPTFNKVTSITDALGDATTFAYDNRGNLVSQTDANGKTTSYTYDATGLLTKAIDPLGHSTRFQHDSFGNLVTITDAAGNATQLRYDGTSRLVEVADSRGRKNLTQYDKLNRVTKQTDAKGQSTTFAYDSNGNVLSLTDARNKATTFAYDALNRLTMRTDPVGKADTRGYDSNGNMVSFTDRRGQTSTFAYDDLNRLIREQYTDGSVVTRSYSVGGRLVQVTDSGGGSFTFGYDLTESLVSSNGPTGSVKYVRDDLHRVQQRQVVGQPPVDYAYDPVGNLTGASILQAAVTYAYDADNRPSILTRSNGVKTDYSYDPVGQLLSIVHSRGASSLLSLVYSYDATGQRISLQSSSTQPLVTGAATATVDDANRLVQRGSTSFTYDANGNLTTETAPTGTTAYAWDARNRLSRVVTPDGQTTDFSYDFSGNLIRQADSGPLTNVSRSYTLDILTNVAFQQSSDGNQLSILTDMSIDSHLATSQPGGQLEFVLSDVLNSTVGTVDQTGALKGQFAYEPFGETKASGSNYPFQFTGRPPISNGLYYLRARFYNAATGRFISEDPIGLNAGDPNLYRYARSTPVNLTDALGLDAQRPYVYRGRQWPDTFVGTEQTRYPFGIDLRHFVAAQNVALSANNPILGILEANILGLGVEIEQLFTDRHSAFNPQDFYSNFIGSLGALRRGPPQGPPPACGGR